MDHPTQIEPPSLLSRAAVQGIEMVIVTAKIDGPGSHYRR
ncbi:MAG: hypothetical protein BroJett011_25610 [Chloroflexota bacterium]|nr:MAG: hypothetical protein BroJett011_25610 [Chloroflexota bacterium]